MDIQVVEVKLKCQVPRFEVEDYICRFRSGEKLVSVPEGLSCKDAYVLGEVGDEEMGTICVSLGR
jgi:hypothetical protein